MSIADRITSIGQHIGNAYDKLDNLGINLYKLPIDYTQLEYIESSGTQYIDTGYKAKNTTRVVGMFNILGYNAFLFGARQSNDSAEQFLLHLGSGGDRYNYRVGNLSAIAIGTSSVTGLLELDMSCSEYTIKNAVDTYNGTITGVNDFSSNYNFYLMALNLGGTATSFSTTKLYKFKILENNTLVRNFIPCYRNSDNEVGLFDIVNNVFYTNQGTGTFIAGTETRETIDKNINNIASLLDTVYNEYPKVSDEGISPSIVGSRVGRLKSTLKASDTTQFTTTGKQLFDNTQAQLTSSSGTKTTVLPTGVRAEVLSTGNNRYGALKLPNSDGLLGKTLTLSATISASASNTANIRFYWLNNTVIGSQISGNLSQTGSVNISIPSSYPSNTNGIAILFSSNSGGDAAVGDYVDYTNVLLRLASITDDAYEPYTNGASPNPNYPQDIHVVKGNNTVEVCGKNLFDKTTAIDGKRLGSDGMPYGDNNYCLTDFINVSPSTSYTYSRSTAGGSLACYCLYDNEKIFISRGWWGNNTTDLSLTLTTSNNARYIRITDLQTLKDNMQLEKGSIFTTYEPYTGITLPITLPVQNLFDKNVEKKSAYPNGNVGKEVSYISSVKTYGYVNSAYLKAGETYTLSWKLNGTPSAITDRDGKIVDSNNIILENIVTWSNDTTYKTFTPNHSGYLILATDINSTDIQIELGDKPNRYTPYGVAPIELCKINTYQDKLFKAISGDTVYDTLTSEQKEGLVSGGWYKYGEAGKYVANNDLTNNGATDYFISLLTPALNVTEDLSGAAFETISKTNLMATRANSVYTGYSGLNGTTSARKIRVTLSKNYCTDVPTANTFLTNNNFTIYFPLATPTITQITDTTLISQLEALYSAMSKNGQTNILQTNTDVPFTIYASALKGG